MEQIRNLEELSYEELLEDFRMECGISYCPYCGKPLEFTKEQLIEYIEKGAITVDCCCHTFTWGDC